MLLVMIGQRAHEMMNFLFGGFYGFTLGRTVLNIMKLAPSRILLCE